MRISTRLRMMVLLPFWVVVVTAAVISWGLNREEAFLQKSRATADIVKGALELDLLVKQYMLFQEERPAEQWRISHHLILEYLKDMKAGNQEEQILIDRMRQDHGRAEQLFSKVIESYKSGFPVSGVNMLLLERLSGQLTVCLATVSNDAIRLDRLSHEQINSFRKRADLLIMSFLLLLAIAISSAAWLLGRRIIAGIKSLDESMEIAASGDLDYRTDTFADDELGLLSRSFAGMTEKLKEVTVSRDELAKEITERKRVEEERRQISEELQHKVTELEASNQELESFSYSISHDLRTPLRSIEGFSQFVLKIYHDKLDAEGKDYLSRINNAAKRLAKLIDDILELSRMIRYEMVRTKVDLSVVAQEIANDLVKGEPDRQAEICIEDGLFADGDPHLLKILLQNLLENAWKYSRKQTTTRVEFGRTNGDGRSIFFVRDNGAGFDMAYAHKLFQPFQRLHDMAEYPGTGIGLATVQRIISRHGGRVWVEAEIGKGATFSFTL